MRFCPNCGTPHEEGAKFCPRCGNGLAAPNPAPQPAPQPVPQPAPQPAPHYQQQPYQQPYQQPPYQAPQFPQPTPYYTPQPAVQVANPASRAAAKKTAIAALVLTVLGFAFDVGFELVYLLSPRIQYIFNFRTVLAMVIPLLIAVVFPVMTLVLSSHQDSKPSGAPFTCAMILLALQAVAVVVLGIGYVVYSASGFEPLEWYFSAQRLFRYIPGAFTGSSLYSTILRIIGYIGMPVRYWLHNLQDPFFWTNIMGLLNNLLYIIGSVISLSAASKLKKS